MTSIRQSTAKRGRCFPLVAFAIFVATSFLLPLECDCFNSVSISANNFIYFRESLCFSNQNSARTHIIVATSLNSGDGGDDSDKTGADTKSLLELLSPMSTCSVNQMSGTDLAYIGDVVFELFVRSRHVWPSKRTSDLQNIVVGLVRAEHQSYLLRQLKASFPLSEKENQVLMRGRNSVTRSKNRRNPAAYQDSTALEALVGYIYITDKDRCQELLEWFETVVDTREESKEKS